jgi:hypothetical protein
MHTFHSARQLNARGIVNEFFNALTVLLHSVTNHPLNKSPNPHHQSVVSLLPTMFYLKVFRMLKSFKLPTKSDYFSSDAISPTQMCEELIEIIMKFSRPIGCNIFDNDYTIFSVPLFKLLFVILFVLTLAFFNAVKFVEDEPVRSLICLIAFTIISQALPKVITFVVLRKSVEELKDRALAVYEKFHTQKVNEICETRMMQVTHFGTVFVGLISVCCFILAIYPLFFRIFGIDAVFLELEIPFIEWKDSWIGFGVHLSMGLYLCYVFVIGATASNLTVVGFLVVAIIQYDILKMLLKELSEGIEGQGKEVNVSRNKEMIQKIVEMHVELLE